MCKLFVSREVNWKLIIIISILIRPAPRPAGQTIAKCELEEYRKHAKADDRNTSIKSRIQFLQPSTAANKVSIAQNIVQKTPIVTENTQSDSYPPKKENLKKSNHTENWRQGNSKHDIEKVDKKGTTAHLRKPYFADSQNTSPKSLEKEAVIESIDKTLEKCDERENPKITSNKLTKDIENKGNDKEACNSLKRSKEGENNTEETGTKRVSGTVQNSYPVLPTCKEKDSRPDSGYETLAGSESRKSVYLEEYGEVDISQVVMRKSRRSIQSFTMNDNETDISIGIHEANNPCTENKSTCEKYGDENCSKRKDCPMSNGDLDTVGISESDEIYANTSSATAERINETEKSEETSEENDVVVPIMRRSKVNKRSTLIDVHVPRVVVEADEDEDDKVSSFSQISVDGDLLTEDQENLLVNLTFEPIAELPFQMKDLQSVKWDFSEIRDLVTQRKSRITNLVPSDKNPVESLRKFVEQP